MKHQVSSSSKCCPALCCPANGNQVPNVDLRLINLNSPEERSWIQYFLHGILDTSYTAVCIRAESSRHLFSMSQDLLPQPPSSCPSNPKSGARLQEVVNLGTPRSVARVTTKLSRKCDIQCVETKRFAWHKQTICAYIHVICLHSYTILYLCWKVNFWKHIYIYIFIEFEYQS